MGRYLEAFDRAAAELGIEILSAAPGRWVEFESPLFGLCTARVVAMEGETITVVEHPVLDGYVTIRRPWIRRVFRMRPGKGGEHETDR